MTLNCLSGLENSRRGTALVMAIIVSVVMTALVSAMVWAAGESAQRTGSLSKSDQAFYAAEAGAQRIAWYCRNKQMFNAPASINGSLNGYTYSVTWAAASGHKYRINSTANASTVSYTMSEQVSEPAGPVPAFSSMGDFDNKNMTIIGNLATGGTYSNGGSGSLTGNLFYGSSASGTGSVSGTVTKQDFLDIDFTQLDTILRASATTMSSGSGKTYDFDTLTGSNKVIYVSGDVTDPNLNGSGTLYVDGNITFTSTNAVIGTVAKPINLVSTKDITFQKTTTMFGDLYAKGNWYRAQVDLTGVVYVGGISPSNNGSSTLTLGSAPWFDTRVPGGVGGLSSTTNYTCFAGPMP